MTSIPSIPLVIDNFAGGGGASSGIEAALGRPVDYAINHNPEALAMHQANHPHTRHLCEDVWAVDPAKLCAGRPVGFAWFSPDCKHFSKAKGGKPVSKRIRGLAWVAIRWAVAVRPRVIILENVEEFQTWGPLNADNLPNKERKGQTFKRWVTRLRNLGYHVDFRELRACDYGAPTIRKRLFLIARSDGRPVVWPQPTHAAPDRAQETRLQPWRTAASCIDWSLPCPSIFDRAKPLAENTLKRIATGIVRFVINAQEPFIVKPNHTASYYNCFRGQSVDEPLQTVTGFSGFGFVSPILSKYHGGQVGVSIEKPLPTITASNTQNQPIVASLVKLRGTCRHGQDARDPLHTVSAGGTHFAEVRVFLVKYYSAGGKSNQGQSCSDPLHTITDRARLGLVTIHSEDYQIVDIGMRMFTPHELFNAQGFPPDYIIDPVFTPAKHVGRLVVPGKILTKTAQIRLCGNSVCPPIAEALVRANCPELTSRKERITP